MSGQTNGSMTPNLNVSNNSETVSGTPMKLCRYSINCSRVDCHFTHPDRRSPSSSTVSSNATPVAPSIASTTNNGGRSSTWFPLQFNMGIDEKSKELRIDLRTLLEAEPTATASNGGNDVDPAVVTTENTNTDTTNEVIPELDTDMKEATTVAADLSGTIKGLSSHKSYKLTAVVCQINNASQKNLVALIYVGNRYHEVRLGEKDQKSGQWYIFNDFR